MPAPRAPEREVDEPLAMTWSAGRVAGVIAAVAMLLFWIWILSGAPKRMNPDHLADEAFLARAEARCLELREDIGALPAAADIATATERAEVLDEANDLLADMIDDLETTAPTEGDDAKIVAGWLSDYRIYLADREAYADALRTDPDAQLILTENDRLSDGVDKTIQVFTTDANDLDACDTPGDVG